MKVYVSGPMRGIPEFNFPAFDSLASFLRREAFDVDNPAEHDREVYPEIEAWPGYETGDASLCPDFDYAVSMRWDIARIVKDDAIAMLPSWWNSEGSRFERFVAEQLGKSIYIAVPRLEGQGVVGWHVYPDYEKRLSGPQVRYYKDIPL